MNSRRKWLRSAATRSPMAVTAPCRPPRTAIVWTAPGRGASSARAEPPGAPARISAAQRAGWNVGRTNGHLETAARRAILYSKPGKRGSASRLGSFPRRGRGLPGENVREFRRPPFVPEADAGPRRPAGQGEVLEDALAVDIDG